MNTAKAKAKTNSPLRLPADMNLRGRACVKLAGGFLIALADEGFPDEVGDCEGETFDAEDLARVAKIMIAIAAKG